MVGPRGSEVVVGPARAGWTALADAGPPPLEAALRRLAAAMAERAAAAAADVAGQPSGGGGVGVAGRLRVARQYKLSFLLAVEEEAAGAPAGGQDQLDRIIRANRLWSVSNGWGMRSATVHGPLAAFSQSLAAIGLSLTNTSAVARGVTLDRQGFGPAASGLASRGQARQAVQPVTAPPTVAAAGYGRGPGHVADLGDVLPLLEQALAIGYGTDPAEQTVGLVALLPASHHSPLWLVPDRTKPPAVDGGGTALLHRGLATERRGGVAVIQRDEVAAAVTGLASHSEAGLAIALASAPTGQFISQLRRLFGLPAEPLHGVAASGVVELPAAAGLSLTERDVLCSALHAAAVRQAADSLWVLLDFIELQDVRVSTSTAAQVSDH